MKKYYCRYNLYLISIVTNGIRVRKFSQWMKRLNLFKVNNERTENDIKQQKIFTRVYLILLTGMIIFTIHISVIT